MEIVVVAVQHPCLFGQYKALASLAELREIAPPCGIEDHSFRGSPIFVGK